MNPVFLARRRMIIATGGVFSFTYTGLYTDVIAGGVRVITFMSSGTLSVAAGKSGLAVTLVGGGGGGGKGYNGSGLYRTGGGGGSGYCVSQVLNIPAGEYAITTGDGGRGSTAYAGAAAGTTTTAFGLAANGGKAGTDGSLYSVGKGGNGGNNGSDGASGDTTVPGGAAIRGVGAGGQGVINYLHTGSGGDGGVIIEI